MRLVLEVLAGVSTYDATARVVFDHPFRHRLIGAADILQVAVGPPNRNIQLRIKVKIVPESTTPTSNESNRAFWRKHIPSDAVCFTFALEGGVPQAGERRYTNCRWVTIRRDGAIYLHPLDGDLGTSYSNNDLGGSAGRPGHDMLYARDPRVHRRCVHQSHILGIRCCGWMRSGEQLPPSWWSRVPWILPVSASGLI